jgi:sporulation integral membrane protein YlbJ
MKFRYVKISMLSASFLLLIMNLEQAAEGIRVGIDMCLQSVIPSLFPFLILTKYISSQLYGMRIPLLSKLSRLCGIPDTMGSALIVGLVGGYPGGAQLVTDAWERKLIAKKTAERMLGFCNNAGPAFIFGVCATMFTTAKVGWYILLIQVFSSIMCGAILPDGSNEIVGKDERRATSFVECFEMAIAAMGRICGWIFCFRVVISYLEAYCPIGNPILRTIVSGILELTNGCFCLYEIPAEPLRFILVSGMLSFGGLCVWLQTASMTKSLSLKWFYVGKSMQCLLSVLLAVILAPHVFTLEGVNIHWTHSAFAVIIIGGLLCWKKVVALLKILLYNSQKKVK